MFLPDRRRLAWAEYGDPFGYPVILCHGVPGSRRQVPPFDALTSERHARLIVPDRAGYGLSDGAPGWGLAQWRQDVGALVDHLKLGDFAVGGVSGGAPFACALVAEFGERVSRLVLVSGVAPGYGASADALKLHPFEAVMVRLAVRTPRLARLLIEPLAVVAALWPRTYLSAMCRLVGEADRAELARADIHDMFFDDLPSAARQGAAAIVRDLAIAASDWQLTLQDYPGTVEIVQGCDDAIVPADCASRLAFLFPQASVRLLAGEGHFFVFSRWSEILAALLARRWRHEQEVQMPLPRAPAPSSPR
ncbi:MAG TPA: alpha/beta fold hydrolase [Solimonas sp.]|jgi:pimeloyl-ACP methyl ester carboxylesterase|uniref:alpha/beta fold hydrolase n=1 Tax=Methyloversatilis TaxID=378210 RepID=UPI002EEA9CA8